MSIAALIAILGLQSLARFFGIIIRMFAELAAPHHRPHFHAYYQDAVGIYAIDPIELLAGDLGRGNAGSPKPGPRSVRPNCSPLGANYRPADFQARFSR